MRKARVGLLLLATERFRTIGAGTPRGTYAARKEREAEKMRADLSSAYDLVNPGLIWDRDADGIRAAIDLFVREKVDCVLELPVSWGEDCAHVRFLRDMPPCPVLFCQKVADTVGLGDTHDEDEFAAYLGHGTLVGSLQASGSNADYARPMFRTFLGTWGEILSRLGPFANAARARTILRDAKVGLLASMNELMWSTYVNPADVFRTIGPEMQFLSVAELADEVGRVTEAEARATMRTIAEGRETLSGVEEASFVASVRATLAMERLAKGRGLDLLVLNDADPVLLGKIGLRPGFYPTPGAGELVVTPEGDVGAGLATYALKLLAGGHVNFIEPFHIDRESGNFAAGHAGPNDYTDPRGSAKISRDVRFAKTNYRWAGAPFAWYVFPPGEKTMVGCSFRNGAFRFTSARLECLETKHFLATYSHALFRFASGDGSALFAPILEEGATQHFAIADGDVTAAVADLAFLLGVEISAY